MSYGNEKCVAGYTGDEPTPAREPEVVSALDYAKGRTNYTAELVTALAGRLAAVMRPPTPQAVSKGDQAGGCALAAAVRDIAGRSAQTNEALLDILDRLEV